MPEMQAGRFGVGSDEGGLELLEEHTGGCRSDFVLDDDMRLEFLVVLRSEIRGECFRKAAVKRLERGALERVGNAFTQGSNPGHGDVERRLNAGY